MSYSRTYRNSNGVGAYRTNLNEGQNERQGATGSQAEQPQQQETAAPSLERRVLTKKKRIETPLHYNVSILASFVELVEYCSRSSWLVINTANRPNRIYLIFPKILFDMFEFVKPLIWGV